MIKLDHFVCVLLEVNDMEEASLETLKLFLDIFDYCSLFIFMLEIALKWIDDFKHFWKSSWNIFDFLVTFAVRIFHWMENTFSRNVKQVFIRVKQKHQFFKFYFTSVMFLDKYFLAKWQQNRWNVNTRGMCVWSIYFENWVLWSIYKTFCCYRVLYQRSLMQYLGTLLKEQVKHLGSTVTCTRLLQTCASSEF